MVVWLLFGLGPNFFWILRSTPSNVQLLDSIPASLEMWSSLEITFQQPHFYIYLSVLRGTLRRLCSLHRRVMPNIPSMASSSSHKKYLLSKFSLEASSWRLQHYHDNWSPAHFSNKPQTIGTTDPHIWDIRNQAAVTSSSASDTAPTLPKVYLVWDPTYPNQIRRLGYWVFKLSWIFFSNSVCC